MVVLELAVFAIKSPHTVDTPEPKSGFQDALKALKRVSGFTFNAYQQIEDPSILYFTGYWPSIEAHNVFLASSENKKLLGYLADYIDIIVMFHADIDSSTPPPDAPCIAIGRHFVKANEKENFAKVWNENQHYLADYAKPYTLVGGWRIDGVEEGISGEWLQFTGYEAVENHIAFGKTKEFEKYGKIREFLEKAEVKHARPLGW